MGINLQINKAKQDIAEAINNTQLPISIISMIIDDISQEVHKLEKDILEREAKEEAEAQEQQNQNEAVVDNADAIDSEN